MGRRWRRWCGHMECQQRKLVGRRNECDLARRSSRFEGTPATVLCGFPGQRASSLTFNVAGYRLVNGAVNGSGTGLVINTNANATILSNLVADQSAPTLIKTGSATLTVAGATAFKALEVAGGEYRVIVPFSLAGSNVTLSDVPGVTLTLAPVEPFRSVNVGSIAGGGNLGGIIQPDAQSHSKSRTRAASTAGCSTMAMGSLPSGQVELLKFSR
jgi:hypothetical protein